MKHVDISRWIMWFLCACVGMGMSCHVISRPVPREVERVERGVGAKPSWVRSTAMAISFSYRWPEDDSEAKTFYFVVPIGVSITPEILSYKLRAAALGARTDSGASRMPASSEPLLLETPVLARQISVKDDFLTKSMSKTTSDKDARQRTLYKQFFRQSR